MGASMMVRWEGWEGRSLEHLALQEEADGITASPSSWAGPEASPSPPATA